MAAIPESSSTSGPPAGDAVDWSAYLPLVLLVGGWLAMFGSSYYRLSTTIWATDAQGHGPIILAVGAWLLYRKREALSALARRPQTLLGAGFLLLGLAAYAIGRSQSVWTLEIGAQILVLVALLLCFYGGAALRLAWFPLFFLAFMIPWPPELVDAATHPLKAAVSVVAASLLYDAGYPVGRSGVILMVGPYQLLVADACAGLNSLFTLEALGLLYMNLMNYQSIRRNVLLALLILPISFCANVVRVIVLVLVTYYFGDEAGQGFVHGFAGMVLFLVALMLILSTDRVIGLVLKAR
ncbi:exosortase B [Aquabacterium sp.]|uniref:exosortase B n=1 Tax=Aquabacterium sp. TaxID=1872578 RepID=UPI0037836D6E